MTGVGDSTQRVDMHERWVVLLAGVGFTLAFLLLLFLGGGRTEVLLILPAIAGGVLLLRNVTFALSALVVLLFIPFGVSYFSGSVAFTVIVVLVFLIQQRKFSWRDLRSPLTVPLFLYGLAVLPSLFIAVDPLYCITLMFNAVAFVATVYATYGTVRDERTIRSLTAMYLGITVVNGVILTILAVMTARRQYGFASIMYVDYAGLGVNVLAMLAIMAKGARRMFLLVCTMLVGIALIMAQTRNAWISAFLTLAFGVTYLIRHPALAGMTRPKLIRATIVGIATLVLVVMIAVAVNPRISSRASSIADTESEETEETVVVKNSLITRLMIWDAALNAFRAHPIVGIGVYGFIKSSRQYSHLPPVIFDLYVRDLSPHVTFIAVLCETGVIGMAGFLFFLVSTLRMALQSVRKAVSLALQRRAFLGLIALVYCMTSMFFTDAWLWGHGIILLGLIIGLVLSNRRMSEYHADDASLPVASGVDG